MIIPQYWAEARLQHRERKRQVTVRRFGWSDVSLEEAQAHADTRVREAFERVLAGETLPRSERRVAYNGAEGVPIREEIVERDGDSVITRNGYGALCLNTPNVFFADIDYVVRVDPRHLRFWRVLTGLMIALSIIALAGAGSPKYVLALVLGIGGGFIFGGFAAELLIGVWIRLTGGHERHALRRVRKFIVANTQWRLRLYRTPAGLRLLALHRLFDPREADVATAFEALGVDPTYARMCRNQNCFRARLTPKPWRLGLPRLRAPYSAAWRLEHAELPARREWIAEYDRASGGHAACRFVEALGHGPIDALAEHVRQLHDLMCQAERDLPLA
jgi:hypothetical protein